MPMRWLLCVLALVMLATGPPLLTRADGAADSIARFLEREEPPLSSYRAVRRMDARNARFKAEGWLEVVTELTADRGLTYEVMREGGSGYIRNKVLRAALNGEVKLLAAGDPARAALAPENYELAAPPARSEDGLLTITAKPRRKDVLLIEGTLFVDPADATLVRIEGQLAKNPSFWTRDVHVIRSYARINGVRVPIRLESTSNVRVAGRSSLTITYDYEQVNGQPVTAWIGR